MAESHALTQLAELAADTLNKRSLMMASVESCTGGPVSVVITDASGSSARFERGFVVYSNEAKSQMLGVPVALIREHGVVSEPVTHVVAEGAMLNSRAQVAAVITGVAGPTGGAPDKSVGMACFGWSNRLQTCVKMCYFKDDRKQVHLQAAEHALRSLLDFLDSAEC